MRRKGTKNKVRSHYSTRVNRHISIIPGLPPRHAVFVMEYLIDLNAHKAAVRAGFSPTTASMQSGKLLSNPAIIEAISVEVAARRKRLEVSQDRVVLELSRIAFLDPARLYNVEGNLRNVPDMDADTAAAISQFDVKVLKSSKSKSDEDGRVTETETSMASVKLSNKLRALELMMAHLGMGKRDPNAGKAKALDLNVRFKDLQNMKSLSREELESLANTLKKVAPGSSQPLLECNPDKLDEATAEDEEDEPSKNPCELPKIDTGYLDTRLITDIDIGRLDERDRMTKLQRKGEKKEVEAQRDIDEEERLAGYEDVVATRKKMRKRK